MVIAIRDIAVGEEIVVMYVDPSLGVRERHSQLVAWGFGLCDCEWCHVEEGKERKSCEDEEESEGKTMSCWIWTT